jgi:hypothetical protein
VYQQHAVSNRHPFARPALPGVHARMGGSDFQAPPPVSSLLTLVHGCPPPTDRRLDLPGYRVFSMSGSTRPRTPGSTRAARHHATRIVACRRDKPVGTPDENFSGLNTFKVGSTRYLCTSPAFVPTHRLVCYQPRRKARYWARGARLPRRDSHPLEHAALPGRTESKPGSCCRLDRSLFSLFAAWFPGGATISRPYDSSFPAPRRTGLGGLHHPAPSLSHPR